MLVRETSSLASAASSGRLVVLAAELDRVEADLEIERAGLAGGQRQALRDRRFRLPHTLAARVRETTVCAQFHWNPETYLEEIRAEVPRYDELQRAAMEAIPFAPDRVLELGMGTGETTRVLLEAYPDAWVIGLDSDRTWSTGYARSTTTSSSPAWRIRCPTAPGTS